MVGEGGESEGGWRVRVEGEGMSEMYHRWRGRAVRMWHPMGQIGRDKKRVRSGAGAVHDAVSIGDGGIHVRGVLLCDGLLMLGVELSYTHTPHSPTP